MGPYAKNNYPTEEITTLFFEYICIFFIDKVYHGETGFLNIRQSSFNYSS